MPDASMLFVDKTPLYLPIAETLPAIFPKARFLVLTRDPRAVLWSRVSWRHAEDTDPENHVESVAEDIRRLAAFADCCPERSHLVSYEALCREPNAVLRAALDALDLDFEPEMVAYGRYEHHEGYGDENSRQHRQPHVDSIDRWRHAETFSADTRERLIDACGDEALERLQLGELIRTSNASAPKAPAIIERRAGDAPRLVAFMHEGTNSRDHMNDFVRGFEQAGCNVARVEFREIIDPDGASSEGRRRTLENVTSAIRTHNGQATLAMWATGFAGIPQAQLDGLTRPLFDAIGVPHLAFWLDAPHWAHQGGVHPMFGTSIVNGRMTRHLINNMGTATEMAGVLGFSNVIAKPYGINPESFRPAADITPEFDLVACIGAGGPPPTQEMLDALDSDDPDHDSIREHCAAAVRQSWPHVLRATTPDIRPDTHDGIIAILEHMLETQLAARQTPMLDRLRAVVQQDGSLSAPATALLSRPSLWVKLTATLRDVETWERAFIFTYLSKRFRCAVFSRPDLDAWNCPAERLGWVGHTEQSAAYARGRAGYNVMRWQDDIGLNPKVMEIAASGIACLCQHRAGLDDLYEVGREVLAFTTAREAAESLSSILEDDAHRRAVAEAGLERTRRDHCWAHRVDELLPLLVSTRAAR